MGRPASYNLSTRPLGKPQSDYIFEVRSCGSTKAVVLCSSHLHINNTEIKFGAKDESLNDVHNTLGINYITQEEVQRDQQR